jgi:UDPglucose 6-dehydrogenase
LYIIDSLLKEGAIVTAFDPEAMPNVKTVMGQKITLADNQYQAIENADALVIATEWNEFRTPDFEKMGKLLKNKVIFDGRNLFDLNQMIKLGYYYLSIGRKTIGGE